MSVFTDYACPFCQQTEAVINEFRQQHPSAQVGYRFLGHPRSVNSRPAALSALCAEQSGALPLFHDSLYHLAIDNSNDGDFVSRVLAYRAGVLGTKDASEFLECTRKPTEAVIEQFRADSALAAKLQVRGTPTIFGKKGMLAGVPTVADLERISVHRTRSRTDK